MKSKSVIWQLFLAVTALVVLMTTAVFPAADNENTPAYNDFLTVVNNSSNTTEYITKTTLWGGEKGNAVETNFGDLVCDAFAYYGETLVGTGKITDVSLVVALEPSSAIKSSLSNNGEITPTAVKGVFGVKGEEGEEPAVTYNDIAFVKVSSADLYDILEESVGHIIGENAKTGELETKAVDKGSLGFFQVGGISFTYNPTAPKGEKVIAVYSDKDSKTPLAKNDSADILLVTNTGVTKNEKFAPYVHNPVKVDTASEVDVVLAYMDKVTNSGTTTLIPSYDQRITPVNSGYSDSEYTGVVKVTSLKNIGGKKVKYYLDGATKGKVATIDSKGYLKITVANGGHGIKLSTTQKEVYVNNYGGAGVSTSTASQIAYKGEYKENNGSSGNTSNTNKNPYKKPNKKPSNNSNSSSNKKPANSSHNNVSSNTGNTSNPGGSGSHGPVTAPGGTKPSDSAVGSSDSNRGGVTSNSASDDEDIDPLPSDDMSLAGVDDTTEGDENNLGNDEGNSALGADNDDNSGLTADNGSVDDEKSHKDKKKDETIEKWGYLLITVGVIIVALAIVNHILLLRRRKKRAERRNQNIE